MDTKLLFTTAVQRYFIKVFSQETDLTEDGFKYTAELSEVNSMLRIRITVYEDLPINELLELLKEEVAIKFKYSSKRSKDAVEAIFDQAFKETQTQIPK
jgi:hypothetical protein